MTNPLKNLKLNTPYKYLLLISGLILLGSIFYDSTLISQLKLSLASLVTVLYGILCWMRENQYSGKINNINLEWQNRQIPHLQAIKDLISGEDYERKEYASKHSEASKLSRRYHRNNWIYFLGYLIILIIILSV